MLTISPSLSRSSVTASETQVVTEVLPSAAKQPPYQADQQVKFLHLEAEVESLLQQMQSIKQQRIAVDRDDAGK